MNIPGSFQPVVNLMYNNVDEMVLPLESVAGYTVLNFGPLPAAGATPTGLANDATLYYVKHQIDAGAVTEVSFAGSTAQTFTALVAALAGVLAGTTVVLNGGEIVVTSATTGTASKVVLTAGTTGADLLTSVRSGAEVYLRSNEHQKGHTKYLRWDMLDGIEQAELGVIMNVLDPSDTEWVHASDSITIVKDTPAPISMFEAIGIVDGTYTLDVTVDSVAKTVSFGVDGGATIDNAYESFALAMRAAFPAATVAEVQTDANTLSWVVTTATPGTAGNVTVAAGTGNDFLAAVTATSLTAAVAAGVVGVDGVAGTTGDGTPIAATAGKAYVTSDVAVAAADVAILAASTGTFYFKVAVDGGAAVEYSIATPAADQSYTAVAALLDAAAGLNAAGVTVSFDDANDRFVFTRTTTGATTSVAVTVGTTGTDVFAQIVTDGTPTAFTVSAVAGTDAIADANFWSLLTTTKAPNGFPVLSSVGPMAIFEREDKPQDRKSVV